MTRPLIITDCDEVLLHMVGPYGEWMAEHHGIRFHWEGNEFAKVIRYADSDEPVPIETSWKLLNRFFETEMHRQYPIAGSVEAMRTLAEHADVVVLTNLGDQFNAARTRQLADHGLDLKVYTNLGPKGPVLQKIVAEYGPSRAVFIDDIAQHHGSVAELSPDVRRLHLCGEPRLAPFIKCAHQAGHAHARIDTWDKALPWLLDTLYEDKND